MLLSARGYIKTDNKRYNTNEKVNTNTRQQKAQRNISDVFYLRLMRQGSSRKAKPCPPMESLNLKN